MDQEEALVAVYAGVALAILAVLLYFIVGMMEDCVDTGGVLVRTVFWFECLPR